MKEKTPKNIEQLIEAGKDTRFSETNQPTPEENEKRKQALKEYWQRKNLKNIIFDDFNKELKGFTDNDGNPLTTWKALIDFLKVNLLSKDSGINKTEKAKLMIKMLEFLAPKEIDATVAITEVPKIVFEIIDVTEKKISENDDKK